MRRCRNRANHNPNSDFPSNENTHPISCRDSGYRSYERPHTDRDTNKGGNPYEHYRPNSHNNSHARSINNTEATHPNARPSSPYPSAD